ncbi:MAG: hypothetical protein QME12_09320 [Nanoarchaeota archaeon]|nr:hypothetical protein [Nanoarchaeota archaeon]
MEKYIILRGEALEVHEANGAFDKCVDELKAEGLEVITARQLAEVRMFGKAKHAVSSNETWLAENFNYLPNGDILVASKGFNPLLQYPSAAKMATACHVANPFREYFLNDDVVESLLEGSNHKGRVLKLKRKDVPEKIRTDEFGKRKITAFLFGDKAEDYGRFLREYGIESVPLYVVDKAYAQKQGQAFSRALWASSLYGNSALYGDSSLFNYYGRAFGVSERSEQRRAEHDGAPVGR